MDTNTTTENRPHASFTEDGIRAAYAKTKTGADYPKLVQDLKRMGVLTYDHLLECGSNVFRGSNGHSVTIGPMGPAVPVTDESDIERLKESISVHQQGLTDFPAFCSQAGGAGVEKWVSDLRAMTVTYLDKSGQIMLVEPIPSGEYES